MWLVHWLGNFGKGASYFKWLGHCRSCIGVQGIGELLWEGRFSKTLDWSSGLSHPLWCCFRLYSFVSKPSLKLFQWLTFREHLQWVTHEHKANRLGRHRHRLLRHTCDCSLPCAIIAQRHQHRHDDGITKSDATIWC